MADVVIRFVAHTEQYEAAMSLLRRATDQGLGNVVQQSGAATANLRALGEQAARTASEVSAGFSAASAGIKITQADIANFAKQFEGLTFSQQAFKLANMEATRGLQAMSQAGKAAREIIDQAGSSITKISIVLGALGATLTAPFLLGVRAAANFEQAMTGVRRTLNVMGDATAQAEANFQDVAKGIRDISASSGMAVESLAGIAAEAGRLGLRSADDVLKFTDAVQKVSQVTGITGAEVARQMSQLATAMDFPITEMDRLGSAIVAVGRSAQASDGQILNMAQMLSATARQVGITTPQVLALAGAISSTGAGSERAAYAFNILIQRMQTSVEEGNGFLDLFAKVAGLFDQSIKSSTDFANLFRADAFKALTTFFQGLALTGEKSGQILSDLGVGGGRVAASFLKMAQNIELVTKFLGLSSEAIKDATELTRQYENVQKDLNDIIKSLGATVQVALAESFDYALPFIKAGAEGLRSVIQWARENPVIMVFAGAVSTLAGSFMALAGAMGFTVRGALSVVSEIGTITDAMISLTAKAEDGTSVLSRLFAGITGGLAAFGRSVGFAIAGVVSFVTTLVGGGGLSAAFVTLNAALGPTGWAILGVTALVGAFAALEYKTGLVSRTFVKLSEDFDLVMVGFNDWARKDVFGPLVQAAEGAGGAISKALNQIGITVPEFIKARLNELSEWMTGWSLEDVWDKVGERIARAMLGNMTVEMWQEWKRRGQEVQDELDEAARWWEAMDAATRKNLETQRSLERQSQGTAEGLNKIGASAKAAAPNLKGLFPSDTDIARMKSKAEDILSDFRNMATVADAELRKAVATGALSQEEALTQQLDRITQQRDTIERVFKDRMAATVKDKDPAASQADLRRQREAELAQLAAKEKDTETEIYKDRIDKANKTQKIIDDANAAQQKNYMALLDSRRALSEETAAMDQTDFERFSLTEKKKLDAALATNEDLMTQIGASGAEILAETDRITGEFARRRQVFLHEGEALALSTTKAMRASMGFEEWEEGFQRQQAALELFQRSYEELSPLQKRDADERAKRNVLLIQEKQLQEDITIARAAAHVGYARFVNEETAAQARLIELEQKRLDVTLANLDTIVNAEQRAAIKRGQIEQLAAQRQGDIFAFMGATTRRWASEQETIFQGFGRMLTNTFDNATRTLSDVFFNVFTGQTVKMQDVWKQMLNALLRELANFLASSTVKFFLQFLGNLMGGQGVGQAASGALGSLFAGTTGGGGGGGTGTAGAVSGVVGGVVGLIGKLFGSGSTTPTSSPAAEAYGPYGYMDSSYDVGGLGYEYYTAGGGEYMASGGVVPGSGRGDIVPAMLEPGEFVVKRSVAEQMTPILDALNGGGQPLALGGSLYMASGGQVSLSGLSGTSITDLQTLAALQTMTMLLQQQLATQQQVAANTGQTAVALGGTASFKPSSNITTLSGRGGNVVAGTAPAGGASGGISLGDAQTIAMLDMLRSSASAVRGLTTEAGPSLGLSRNEILGTRGTLSLLSGGLGLYQGILAGQPLLSASGGLQALSGVSDLLKANTTNPELLSLLGYTGGVLNVAGGALGITQGVQSGSPTQIAGGSLQALQGAVAIAQQAGLISSTAGGIAGGTLGGLGGALGVYQSITDMMDNGVSASNAISLVANAYGVYSGVASVLSAAGVVQLPTLSTAIGSAITAITGGTSAATLAGTTTGTAGFLAAEIGATGATVGATTGATTGAVAGATTGAAAGATTGAASGTSIAATAGVGTALGVTFAAIAAPFVFAMLMQMAGEGGQMINFEGRPEGWSDYVTAKRIAASQIFDAANQYSTGIAQQSEQALAGSGPIGANDIPALMQIGNNLQDAWLSYFRNTEGNIGQGGIGPSSHTSGTLAMGGWNTALADWRAINAALRIAGLPGLPVSGAATVVTGIQRTGPSGEWAPWSDYGLPPAPLGTPQGEAWLNSAYMDYTAGTQANLQLEQSLLQRMTGQLIPLDQLAMMNDMLRIPRQPDYVFPEIPLGANQYGGWSDANVSPGGLQHGGWVPGVSRGYDSVPMMLEPGEFVVPRNTAQRMGPALSSLLGHGAASDLAAMGPQQVHYNVSIVVNGNVDDPEELARIIAPKLRDELRRIEPRYSRAGNKTQA